MQFLLAFSDDIRYNHSWSRGRGGMVDTLSSGGSGIYPCEFNSHRPHQMKTKNSTEFFF